MKMKLEGFPDPGKIGNHNHHDIELLKSSITMPTYRKQLSLNPYKSISYKHNGNTYQMKFNDLIRTDENNILGQGVSSIVIEMFHEDSNKSFAVKRVPKKFYEFETNCDKEQLLEPDALENVKYSQDIVKYYGYFYLESYVWIIMDKMDFCLKTFYQKVKEMNKIIPERILAVIAYRILRVIQYLEKNSLMHRDIKPDNVMLDSDGEIKLCDFGTVGLMNEKYECSNKSKGTERYKAPEKFSDGNHGYTVKSELWSLGLTLLEAANMRKPYENVPTYGLKNEICNNEVPKLNDEHYSKTFSDFLDLCLQPDEAKRADLDILMSHEFIKSTTTTASNETDSLEFIRSVIKSHQT